MRKDDNNGHGNRIYPERKLREDAGVVRKVTADSVPFGESISTNGKTVWVCVDAGGKILATAATAPEARRRANKQRTARELADSVKARESLQ